MAPGVLTFLGLTLSQSLDSRPQYKEELLRVKSEHRSLKIFRSVKLSMRMLLKCSAAPTDGSSTDAIKLHSNAKLLYSIQRGQDQKDNRRRANRRKMPRTTSYSVGR